MVSADTNGGYTMWLLQMCSCVHEYLPWPGKAYGASVVSAVLSEQRSTFTSAYIPHWSDFHILFFIFLLIWTLSEN